MILYNPYTLHIYQNRVKRQTGHTETEGGKRERETEKECGGKKRKRVKREREGERESGEREGEIER